MTTDTIREAIERLRRIGSPIPSTILVHPVAWRKILHMRSRIEARDHKRALRKRQTIRQRIQAIAKQKQGRVAA